MGTEVDFKYIVDVDKFFYDVSIPIKIPFEDEVEELAQRLILMFNLPKHIEKDLSTAIFEFVKTNMTQHYDSIINNLIENSKISIDDSAKAWDSVYREVVEETTAYYDHVVDSDEEVFGVAYHKLVHSTVLDAILQIEHSYAQGVRDCVKLQDEQISHLTSKQMSEMSKAVEALDITTSEQKINALAIQHFEDHSLLQAEWSSELNTMKEVQRREFRNWIMSMLEEHASAISPLRSPRLSFALPINVENTLNTKSNALDEILLEESFTIHLGSQMKQMYNIRLLSADVTDFCKSNAAITSSQNSPQRLQTAMSLYSNDICGLVLLTDCYLGFTNITKELINICQQSTEFHFLHIEDQIEHISDCIKQNVNFKSRTEQYDSRKYLCADWQAALQSNLKTGDFFMTRHSNLSKVHVVFHLMVDGSLRLNDINSRHKVILGLRNILKMACSNNITTLTIPLLLQHNMTEEMTVNWCTKRAELIFKCIKGFMIEMASWGGSELKNLQFLIPKDISTAVFTSLATMLPSIFKLSNPVVLKAIHNKHS